MNNHIISFTDLDGVDLSAIFESNPSATWEGPFAGGSETTDEAELKDTLVGVSAVIIGRDCSGPFVAALERVTRLTGTQMFYVNRRGMVIPFGNRQQ